MRTNVAQAITRFIRRFIPSVPPLTYNRAIKAFLNGLDLPFGLVFPEFRTLPPNHLRVRIGVGWRLANNQPYHLAHAQNFWFFALAKGLIRPDSDILDIGIGCGRFALHLRDFRFIDHRYSGTYVGVDIDAEMLAWCAKNFPSPQFRFHRSTHRSAAYQAEDATGGYYVIPEPDESFDFVFSTSLLTHLLEDELDNYLAESFRLLRPGQSMLAYCFCLDSPPPTFGGRHTFSHRMGNAFVESPRCPEAAVAYRRDFLFDRARHAGFLDPEMLADGESWQSVLICRKPIA